MAASRIVLMLLLLAVGDFAVPPPMEAMEAPEGVEESEAALHCQHGRRRSLRARHTMPAPRLADRSRVMSVRSSARVREQQARPAAGLDPVRKAPPAASDSAPISEDH